MRAVLTYHSIDASGSPISVAPEAFTRHLAWLTSERVVVEPLAAIAAPAPPDGDPRPRVALAFDDGFANFASWAWPRLRHAGLPATVFLVSGHMGGTNAWGGRAVPGIPTLPVMSWEAAAACAAEGAAIGAHTRTHPHLPALTAEEAHEEMAG
ncbi:MAG TPA: polysaccharide deacetylase family protein, partial [Vicinamibacterales bacterium]|nr:polysaccharide deacetylase family protein [Vicinamibacterales bacterium]